jgi:oxidase EvaA
MMMNHLNDDKHELFLKSALQLDGDFCSTTEVLGWLASKAREVHVNIEHVKLSQMRDWYFNSDRGVIQHVSGKFFSIDGIRVEASIGEVKSWCQPIINQPEIGYLGCIVKEFSGILYFAVQAKIEPGNINSVQLSPTLQATRSNYMQQHKGNKPKYLDYFIDKSKSTILIDQLQSEQGARFLNKRNRNIIVRVDDEINLDDEFLWLTLGQIKRLCAYDNIVNMDLRTVISGIPFDKIKFSSMDNLRYSSLSRDRFNSEMLESAVDDGAPLNEVDEIISWLTELKSNNDLLIKKTPLNCLAGWELTDEKLHHIDNLYFDVNWISVEIENREVAMWHQPIVKPHQEGVIAFIVKKINERYHFLVQAKIECGNFDTFEFAPTVQCITGSYVNSIETVPFLKYVLNAQSNQIKFDALLSEEGGRFYHEQNRNLIIEADESFPDELPSTYMWMTLNQLLSFVRFNNYLNIQARSLLAVIEFA